MRQGDSIETGCTAPGVESAEVLPVPVSIAVMTMFYSEVLEVIMISHYGDFPSGLPKTLILCGRHFYLNSIQQLEVQ